MILTHLAPVLAFLLILSAEARAQSDYSEAYVMAFASGQYEEACTLALQIRSPDRLAFAARSLLAEAISASEDKPSPASIHQARELAAQALELSAQHHEARLQLAIALSLQVRDMSAREAWRSGSGKKARDLAQAVLEEDPENAYAHGFLAVWHIEVRRRGGRLGASLMGASITKASQHYQLARALRPHDAGLHWQYARALAALDARKHKDEIRTALQASLRSPASTALDTVMQKRANDLWALFHHASSDEVSRRAANML